MKNLFLILLVLCGCAKNPGIIDDNSSFEVSSFETEIPFASPEIVQLHEKNLATAYHMGPGDKIKIDVWNRPKLSNDHIVGPFGNITLPLLGEYNIGNKSRAQATDEITGLYTAYYNAPIVTIKINSYMNNKVYVLGRVSNPGVIHFDGGATLLEALSKAGGLPTRDRDIFLSKCYIVRGNDQIIWVNLLELLQHGDTRLNIKLANNDIIYIPESMDAAVFVMGEINNPGSYMIQTSGLSMMDALNLAGGPTEDAQIEKIHLIREMQEQQGVLVVNLEEVLKEGDFSHNYLLKDNDIIYIPRKGIAGFNYYIRQIDPFLRTFISAIIIRDALSD